MEHVITKHVLKHLESNSLLYDLQHGFRHSRSCETQLLSFVQELAANSDKNIQTDLIIMDFAKAFDKVPHQRLLYKLKFYGIKNQTLTWISAFLSNRTQTVVLDGESSDIAPVTSGVPQGTVLGPVLFLVYINDLSEYMKSSQLRLFADDSIIYKTIKSQKDCDSLQEDLDAATTSTQNKTYHVLQDCSPYSCSSYNNINTYRPKNQTISSIYIQISSCIQRSVQVLILSEHNYSLEFTTSN